jgi:predicted NBD/HSP70 family sugar kinase
MTCPTEPARIAVLDIGKTNLKLLVASEDGRPLEAHSIPNTATTSGPYLRHGCGLSWYLLRKGNPGLICGGKAGAIRVAMTVR